MILVKRLVGQDQNFFVSLNLMLKATGPRCPLSSSNVSHEMDVRYQFDLSTVVASVDQLSGNREQRIWNGEAERLSRREIND
jgi:hypothetical protein